MRRLFTIIVSLLMLSSVGALAQPSNEKTEEQKTETENKDNNKKDDDKDKKKPRKPIQIVVYEFAWSWVTR